MPELPEVETTRRGIEPHLLGRQITRVIARRDKLRWAIPQEVITLKNARIQAIHRRSKYLLFDVGRGQMLVHLGMTGNLRILPADTPPQKHDHIDWQLDNGQCLRFHDPRRFGAVLWNPAGQPHPLLQHLGPEPLEQDFTAAYMHQQAKGRRVAIKSFLMNAKIVVGVGNIYAQESLFLAGINPKTPAGRISLARWQRLVSAIKQVLTNALEAGGTSFSDFLNADGKPGYFEQQLNVYGRAGKPCHQCGHPIRQIKQGQRSTCYCTQCQR